MNMENLATRIIDYCRKNEVKKIYICGNCGSGKTTLSKKIIEIADNYGKNNRISTDDFMIDMNLRKNAQNKWTENGEVYVGRYTSSNEESYFFKNIYEIFYNLDHKIDCYYFPRRYLEKNNIRKLYSESFLTIVEGVGTAFLNLEDNKILKIFLYCDETEEQERLESRTRKLNRNNMDLYDNKRASQFRINVLSKKEKFDVIIKSEKDFKYSILKNSKNI